jgi:hypothetical protein
MGSKPLTTLVALQSLISPVLFVLVTGYLRNACNSEELYEYTPTDGDCIDD